MSDKKKLVTLARKQSRDAKYVQAALIVRAVLAHEPMQARITESTLIDASKVGH